MVATSPLIRHARCADASRRLAGRLAVTLSLVFGAGVAALAMPAISFASNAYWSDSSAGTLRSGGLLGGSASTLFAGEGEPAEIALNPAAGTIYWADSTSGQIVVANLNGTGTPQTLYTEAGAEPTGVAVDAAAGKLYWTDAATGKIQVASTAGGGTPQTLFTEPTGARPLGLARGDGRLYWADEVFEGGAPGEIRSGSLTGGTASTLYTEPEGSLPTGLAIDSSASRLYWTDAGSGAIRYGPLGGGTATTLYTEATAGSLPRGIAVDAASGALYWADAGTGVIATGTIAGSAAPGSLFAEETTPSFPALLLAPEGTGVPKIGGQDKVGNTLSCGTGNWASNQPGANLYQAPQTYAYQWLESGTAITGANASTYAPSSEGSYTCTVTAANAGGATAQTSLAAVVTAQPPTATISSPVSGATYEQDASVPTAFTCAEGAGGPGLASCKDGKGTSSPTGKLDTSSLGAHTYTVTAISKDGQRASTSVAVTIVAKKAAPPPPPPPARPRIAIKVDKAPVKSRRTAIALACSGGKRCAGKLSLTATVKRPGAKRKTEVLFVRMNYSLAAGKRKSISLRLSKQAKKLLAEAKGRSLNVRARVTVSGGTIKHRGVVLHLQRPS